MYYFSLLNLWISNFPENATNNICCYGVVFTTSEGLFYAVGNQVNDLTAALYGAPNTDLKGTANFQLRVNHLNLVQLQNNLSTVDAKVYVSGSLIGFNKK